MLALLTYRALFILLRTQAASCPVPCARLSCAVEALGTQDGPGHPCCAGQCGTGLFGTGQAGHRDEQPVPAPPCRGREYSIARRVLPSEFYCPTRPPEGTLCGRDTRPSLLHRRSPRAFRRLDSSMLSGSPTPARRDRRSPHNRDSDSLCKLGLSDDR